MWRSLIFLGLQCVAIIFCVDMCGQKGTASSLAAFYDPLPLEEVNLLVSTVKIHVYKPPAHINLHMERGQGLEWVHAELETRLYEDLQQMSRTKVYHLVDDPADADFFFVPHALMTHVHLSQSLRLQVSPSWDMAYRGINHYMKRSLEPFLLHIVQELPFYNASGGRDHIFLYLWDNGPICDGLIKGRHYDSDLWQRDARAWQQSPVFRAVVHPMIIVGYHGSVGFRVPPLRGALRKQCFAVDYDITLPQYNLFHRAHSNATALQNDVLRQLLQRLAQLQMIQCPTNGMEVSHGNFYYQGTKKRGVFCSPKARIWLHEAIMDNRTYTWARTPHAAIYGLCPAGWGCWSLRFYHMLHKNVIPVIMADGIVQPFERFLDYTKFSAKVLTGISGPALQRKLQALHESAVSFRQSCLACNPAADTAFMGCAEHPVTKRFIEMQVHAPWFSWDAQAARNVYKLFLLELFCRKARNKDHRLCLNTSTSIAYSEWW